MPFGYQFVNMENPKHKNENQRSTCKGGTFKSSSLLSKKTPMRNELFLFSKKPRCKRGFNITYPGKSAVLARRISGSFRHKTILYLLYPFPYLEDFPAFMPLDNDRSYDAPARIFYEPFFNN